MKLPHLSLRILLTATVILIALILVGAKFWQLAKNPWTRDGQVRANVILVTPRVSGPVVSLPIRDNQFVKAGDILFKIDPRTFESRLQKAEANLGQTRDALVALQQQVDAAQASVRQSESAIARAKSGVEGAQSEFDAKAETFTRSEELVKNGVISKETYDTSKGQYGIAQANLQEAQAVVLQSEGALTQAQATLAQAVANLGAPGEENPQLRAAEAAVESAKLDVEFTTVRASVDGYVTNLSMSIGSQAVIDLPTLALVDVNSYWIDAYFRETWVGRIAPGDEAVVTLMSYPESPLKGTVESIAWGIDQGNGVRGAELLPKVNPTFDWIRLAQRIPVLIRLGELPPHVALRIGSTASIMVRTGTAESKPPK